MSSTNNYLIMRNIIYILIAAATLFSCGQTTTKEKANDKLDNKMPNILLLVGDDIAFGDLGAYGSEIPTPNMNRLADAGVRFTNFHASPVCSVTRSMLMTGCNNIEVGLGSFDYSFYPPTKGVSGYEGYLTSNTVTISQLLKDAGYETYKSGKWHLGGEAAGGQGPLAWGFTKEFGILSGGSNHWNDLAMTPDFSDPNGLNVKRKEHFTLNGEHFDRPEGVYSGELYTKHMLNFIKEGHAANKPWFAYMAFTTAHFPIQAPADMIEKHYQKYLELGYAGLKKERYESLKNKGLITQTATEPFFNDITLKGESESDDEKKIQAKVMATYAAMIEDQDNRTGQILDYLKESGQLDNTLVIYVTDNGPEGFEATHPKTGNPEMAKWVETQFDQSFEAIGTAESEQTIGVSWANAATGGLQWWKWFIGEGGIRVPMMIVPPGAFSQNNDRSGQISNAVMSVKDLPMTILDYAGVTHPQTMYKGKKIKSPSGITARPFLEGESDVVRTEKEWYAFELFGNGYLMQGNYKIMKVRKGMFGDGEWHLYDVVADPSEMTPLETKMPEKFKAMKAQYLAYAEENNIMEVDEAWNPFKAASD